MTLSTKPLPELLDDFAIAAINNARDPSEDNIHTLGMVREQVEELFGSLFDQVKVGPEPEIHGKTDVAREMECAEFCVSRSLVYGIIRKEKWIGVE